MFIGPNQPKDSTEFGMRERSSIEGSSRNNSIIEPKMGEMDEEDENRGKCCGFRYAILLLTVSKTMGIIPQ
jgi:hypothetical protein